MSQTNQEVKQVAIEYTIRGYYLRLEHLTQDGTAREEEPYRFLARKRTGLGQLPVNEKGDWTDTWQDDFESAYLFADPDEAAAEVKRLSELPMAIDDDNADPDDKTPYLVPCPEMVEVLDKDYLYDPIFARFTIVPVVETKPIHVADYHWKLEKATPEQLAQLNKESN